MSSDVVIGDWGSTRLRLWRLVDGEVAERREGPGMAGVTDPVAALHETLAGWAPERIALCGMAGARNGLREAPYIAYSGDLEQWKAGAIEIDLDGTPVTIAAGFSRPDDDGPPDVMRGEETQAFGAMALNPVLAGGDHKFVLPGTHSKWVWMSDGSIVGFATFITGELYRLLENSSLYKTPQLGEGDEETGFEAGLERAGEWAGLSSTLFEARAAQMCGNKSSTWAKGFVSGALIGTEIQSYGIQPAGSVTLIGDARLLELYARAFAHFGVSHERMDGEECAIAGLRQLL